MGVYKYYYYFLDGSFIMPENDPPTTAPKFLSRGHLYKVIVGETIELPCKVQNLGSFVLLWRKGSSVLTAGHLKITRDQRFKIVGDYNLQINGVKTQDAGDYICQLGDQENRDQVHTVEILGNFRETFYKYSITSLSLILSPANTSSTPS